MINIPPLHSTKKIEAKIIPAVLKSWQIGAILESRAKTSSNAEGELQVQIGQHLFDAKTKSPIAAGQPLTLRVAKLGDEPLLKILSTPIKTDSITLLLRQAIPHNESIQKLINQLSLVQTLVPKLEQAPLEASKTNNTNFDKSSLLSLNQFNKQISSLIQLPIKSDTITPKNIQAFLQQSGFNLENQVLTQKLPSNNLKLDLLQLQQTVQQLIKNTDYSDIIKDPSSVKSIISNNKLPVLANYLLYNIPITEKSNILSLLSSSASIDLTKLNETQALIFRSIKKFTAVQTQQLKQWIQFIPALNEMKQLIDQSISTITNHQLQALQADADSAFMVLFNLLVAKNPEWIDVFNIQINKDQKEDNDDDHWRVTIQMDMPKLGMIEAKLILVDRKLHAGVTSQLLITHQLIKDNIGILNTALKTAGFDIETISCQQAIIKPFTSFQKGHSPLLDDKA